MLKPAKPMILMMLFSSICAGLSFASPGIPAYLALKELVDSGELKIISIISTARSGSTIMERVLGNHESIDLHVNEPFSSRNPEETYQYIYNKVAPVLEAKVSRPVYMVVKDMPDTITIGEGFENWKELTDSMIFQTRNPMLTIESFFREIIFYFAAVESEEDLKARKDILKKVNYPSLKAIASEIKLAKKRKEPFKYVNIGPILKNLIDNFDESQQEEYYRVQALQQVDDFLAKKLGYKDVKDLLQATDSKSITDFSKTYWGDCPEFFSLRPTGTVALYQHALSVESDEVIFLDSTLFRLSPETVSEWLTTELGLGMSLKMLKFERPLDRGYEGMGPTPFYDRAANSTKVDFPSEKPTNLSHLPEFAYAYLFEESGAVQIYQKLLQRFLKIPANIIRDALQKRDPESGLGIQDIDPFVYQQLKNISR